MMRLMLLILAASALRAQWPEDPAANLLICGRAGEQSLPKIVATGDGGCYISWQDNGSGNYDTWLQRLDADGVPQWEDGLLVSGHPQDTWITDYDLAVDQADCAIVAINDIRRGADRDITAYRISPDGDFLWGADGQAISDNEGFEPDPRICVTTEGNVVFAWQEDAVLHLRKVDADGADLWTPAVITLSGEFPLSIPRLAPAPGDAVLLQFLAAQGSQFWSPKHLVVQRFNSAGQPAWAGLGVAIQTAGGFGPQMRPDLRADGAGGAWCFWYDSRDNQLHAYAQHLLESGVPAWTANGVPLSTTAGELQDQPRLVIDETGEGPAAIELYYRITDLDQNLMGIAGQRLSSTGERLWGPGGLVLHPLAASDRHSVVAVRGDEDHSLVGHLHFPTDVMNCQMLVQAVGNDGEAVWEPAVTTASTVLAPRGNLTAATGGSGQLIAVWKDQRADAAGDIFLQNVNPDGSLGPWEEVEVEAERGGRRPARTLLHAPYPNPFNPATTIAYELDDPARVRLEILDLHGRQVAILADGIRAGGIHRVNFQDDRLASGIYVCRLEVNGNSRNRKLILLK